MSLSAATEQARVAVQLMNSIKRDRVAHVYLFSGPSGTGKKNMARSFAQALLCRSSSGDACDECSECRRFLHGNHPDFYWLAPDGSSIKIDQIRELQKQFTYRSAQQHKKVYVIEQADRMTTQAANSLLKFLEEPTADLTAILITDNGQAILPTIHSRSQHIPFHPMPPETMVDMLSAEGLPGVLVRPAVYMAAGLDAARALCQLNEFAELRKIVIQLAKECMTQPNQALLTIHHKIVKTPYMDFMHIILPLWMLWGKDMLQIQNRRNERNVFIDQLDWQASKAYARDTSYWIRWMEQAMEQEKRLKFHANPQLALEQLIVYSQGV